MRLPTERQALAFLEPLRGKSCIIMVNSRRDDAIISRFILTCLALSHAYVIVFDTSALIGTNIDEIAGHLPRQFLQRSNILIPSDEIRLDASLGEVLTTETPAFFLDDLNALLYLLSPIGERSAMRHLSSFFHLLAYNAHLNGAFAIGSAYKSRSGTQSPRSLSAIADIQMTTQVKDGELSFTGSGIPWPGGSFTVPYLEPST